MDVNLEAPSRLAEIIKTAILTRQSESTLDSNAPDDVVLKVSAIAIAETAQFDGHAAKGEDIGEFSRVPGAFNPSTKRNLGSQTSRRPRPSPRRWRYDRPGPRVRL